MSEKLNTPIHHPDHGVDNSKRRTKSLWVALVATVAVLFLGYKVLFIHDPANHSPSLVETDATTKTHVHMPMGSVIAIDVQPDINKEFSVTSGAEGKQDHNQRLAVLFTLAVGATILVQLSKAIIRFGGWLLLLAVIAALVDAVYVIMKTNVWPKVQENVLPQVQSKMPAMPKMPAIKLPAIKLPFGKKSDE